MTGAGIASVVTDGGGTDFGLYLSAVYGRG
jgi:hypothetical protein